MLEAGLDVTGGPAAAGLFMSQALETATPVGKKEKPSRDWCSCKNTYFHGPVFLPPLGRKFPIKSNTHIHIHSPLPLSLTYHNY